MIEVRVVDEAVVAVLECGLGVIDILSPTVPTPPHHLQSIAGRTAVPDRDS